jgi:2-polyprenyl-3-methyl-5-hydroxy-6-metoxy-1,4-benzoquinol methylase
VPTSNAPRSHAYGEHRRLTPVDRFGVWLSSLAVRRHADFAGKRIADFGCGFDARFTRSILRQVASACLVDVHLAEDLKQHARVSAMEGPIEEVLPTIADASIDVVLCLSVLEHLSDPQAALDGFRRILADEGVLLVNVPSWRGKVFLELSAFRLGLSPPSEMDDHKRYYDPRDLWPMLVRAGFRPSHIRCHRHKFGLNTFATCRNAGPYEDGSH